MWRTFTFAFRNEFWKHVHTYCSGIMTHTVHTACTVPCLFSAALMEMWGLLWCRKSGYVSETWQKNLLDLAITAIPTPMWGIEPAMQWKCASTLPNELTRQLVNFKMRDTEYWVGNHAHAVCMLAHKNAFCKARVITTTKAPLAKLFSTHWLLVCQT